MSKAKFSYRWTRFLYMWRKRGGNFLGSQWAGGVVLVVFAAIALVLANTDATRHAYHHFLETDLGFSVGRYSFSMKVEQWINDALMAMFFFVVGLEIKREIMVGQLSNRRQAMLPIAAAVGGMAVPALIYLMINAGTEYEPGWGIPMATDIAFAIGVLSLLGRRVPLALKIFLTALAIVDDLGAILVIAVFYTSSIDFAMLGLGLGILALMFALNKLGVTSVLAYLIPGLVMWFLFLNSGVHATIAGVLAAMAIPTEPRFPKRYFTYKARYFLEEFRHHDREGVEVITNPEQTHALSKLNLVAHGAMSPSQRLEHAMNPLVSFLVIPVFALANAGVEIGSAADLRVLTHGQGLGIFLGLVVGKPIGIFLFSWLAIKSRLGVMPTGGTWGLLLGVACLGGIGFTMSIFIDTLAFSTPQMVDAGKISVFMASITAAVIGSVVTNIACRRKSAAEGTVKKTGR